MGYKKLDLGGGGKFFKFDKIGTELEGEWRGVRPGKFERSNGMIVDEDGERWLFTISTALEELEFLPIGTKIKLVYTGNVPTKRGMHDMKKFEVWADESLDTSFQKGKKDAQKAGESPSKTEGSSFKATDDDVPF